MAHRILDDNGHVIPEKVDMDIHNAYALIRRNIGDFHYWLAHPKEAKDRLTEVVAKESEKSETKIKFDPTDPKFQKFAKSNPRYAELVKAAKEADTEEKVAAVKKASGEFYDEMKKAYTEILKKAA